MSQKHDEPPAYGNNPAYPQQAYYQGGPPPPQGAAGGYYQQQQPMGYGGHPQQGPPPGGYYQQGPYPPGQQVHYHQQEQKSSGPRSSARWVGRPEAGFLDTQKTIWGGIDGSAPRLVRTSQIPVQLGKRLGCLRD
ncbi:predicted protein [Chaetomium globosum CBS 148.51]|uniref:Uncharacterized protein n=1 Tax=Chaetomium globosum (strain ATCC 6205 / CBS 148.51 / DSM 1962 / NBRC 6347 / NRRL 1970) TaxID=306901 RepID=Q2H0N5_CHAGB|nr:uncharacterized protein CHGG_04661 [Chaetomium globosum CBS 148.51]EAQ88042.1 predicted protein [Chaetomium globosum CBS 148.51]